VGPNVSTLGGPFGEVSRALAGSETPRPSTFTCGH